MISYMKHNSWIKRRSVFIFIAILSLAIFFQPLKKISTNVYSDFQSRLIYKNCQEKQDKRLCYAENFRDLTEKTGYIFAYSTLGKLENLDIAVSACHLTAHAISETEVKKHPQNWIKVANIDPVECSGGFIHGALGMHVWQNPQFTFDAKSINDICSAVHTSRTPIQNCYHTMGHLGLIEKQGNIAETVSICNALEQGMQQLQCYTGIFMENIVRDLLVSHGIAQHIEINEQSAKMYESICKSWENNFAVAQGCYLEIARVYVDLYQNDGQKVFNRCNTAPDPDFAHKCSFHAAGLMAINLGFDPQKNNDNCQKTLNPEDFRTCVLDSASATVYSSIKNAPLAGEFCSLQEGEIKKECYGRIEQILTLEPEKSSLVCASVPQEFQNICKNQ